MEKLNVALVGNSLRPFVLNNMVYGYDIAANELVESILNYKGIRQINCFFEPYKYQDYLLTKKIKRLNTNKIKKISEYDLIFNEVEMKENFDIIHNVDNQFKQICCLRENLDKKIPISFTIHCASYHNYIEDFFLMMLHYPLRPYDTLICTSTAVEESVRNILSKLESKTGITFNGSLEKIPLGVDTNKFKPRDKIKYREKYNIDKNSFVILWFGRFDSNQKADLFPLLLTFKNLLTKNPQKNLILLLAGSQPKDSKYISELKNYCNILNISDKVEFMIDPDTKNRQEIYNLSDIFTSPVDNIQETFGITPIEAMASGIPQVVSDWNGYKDTVEHGITGFRVPTFWIECDDIFKKFGQFPYDQDSRGEFHSFYMSQSVVVDVNEYEKSLQKLIDDKKLRNKMAENSRQKALKIYEWEKVMAEYHNLWNNKIALAKKTYDSLQSEKSNLFNPEYFNSFKNYATTVVACNLLFKKTSYSFEKEDINKEFSKNNVLLEQNLINNILQFVKRNDSFSINNLIDILPRESEEKIKIVVMHLWKYGMIERKEENVK